MTGHLHLPVGWILVLVTLSLYIAAVLATNWLGSNANIPPELREKYFATIGMNCNIQ